MEDVKSAIANLEKDGLLLDLIPIAFNDDLESKIQSASLFVDTPNSINIIWDFILISFRFHGEPEGLYKCYSAEFNRLDKFFVEHSTLPVAEAEVIIDIFKYFVNINSNLLNERDIDLHTNDVTTNRFDTDVVMEETLVPRVTGQLGSISLTDLILSPAETQMDTWKPDANKIMQQFRDFDNEGFDVSKCLFDVLQNSKLRYMSCKEVFLFGLKFSEDTSAANWASRSMNSYPAIALPETFEELQKIPVDKVYNFLMSLDRVSIDKEIERLGVEALMFWELPKVENALNELCQNWFFNDNGAHLKGPIDIYDDRHGTQITELTPDPSTVIVGSVKEKEQCIELGFVDRLIQLWRLRKTILEAKAEMLVSGTLAKYTYRAGEAIMSKTLTYKSSYMSQLFKARNASITKEEKRLAALTMYENFICQYKAILLQCERDFDIMINVTLYQEIVLPFFTIKHGQFAAVALVRSGANKLLRKTWEAFIIRRDRIVLRDHHKSLANQKKFDHQLKIAQQSAGQQIDNRVDQSLSGLAAKVKSIIKDTVKSTSIKKENMDFDQSLLECDLTSTEVNTQHFPRTASSSSNSKRNRQPDFIDLRSPTTSHIGKKHDARKNARDDNTQPKGYLNTILILFQGGSTNQFHIMLLYRIWEKLCTAKRR